MSSGSLLFEALGNVEEVADVSGCRSWRALTEDPQLLLSQPGARHRAWPGGWYLLKVRATATSGEILAPCLYPDFGTGRSELERIHLPEPDAEGWIRAIVRLKGDATSLRFDPTIRAARFKLEGGVIRKLRRAEALVRMAAAIGNSPHQKPSEGFFSILFDFVRHAFAGRTREGGEQIYDRYVVTCAAPGLGYDEWVRRFDLLRPGGHAELRKQADTLVRKPLISIVMPVYQTPEAWLRRCIDSVLAQAYPHWELCIADDASPAPHVRRVLQEYMRRDARIRVVFRDANGHIAAASNSALEIASGEYVALLDHDDELPPHALLEVAQAIQANPDWKLIYSDEDKIDEKGRRFDPYFKPDWNYELFLSQNCVCHFGVYQAGLVAQVGGFRVGLEGSQDWDLALRCVERLRPEEIGHIPKILYHWRAIAGSTALGVAQKDYACDAGWRAVSEHLQRAGVEARVEMADGGYMKVRRKLQAPAPRVSLLIPTRDKVELLRMCIQSILEKTDYPDYEILIVDNQSEERATLDYFAELASQPRVKVLRYNAPFNYSAINNFAAAAATGSIIGLVNNDIEVISPDWMTEMASQVARPEIGAVGAMLLYPDDTIQHAGVILGIGGIAGHAYAGLPAETLGACGRAQLAQEMSAVTAACLFVRKEVFDEVAGLDEKLSVAFNDIDFCLRVRARGYRNLWTPYVRLYHHESASRGYEDTPAKIARFQGEMDFMRSRWGESLLRDPAYNPNLSLDTCHFDLAFPPR
ncbi:glycosyltransferase family 2 protein [Lysobacter koreensis]|uniref:Glycosyltransferase family 2 protein n=1 Tax=Lysobacter koreensis TaxID=266122 RepID=A0ABW2YKV5_9GAMM